MNKPFTISITVIILLITSSFAMNAQSIEWMRDAGSTPFDANENGYAVDADKDGNAYVLGHLAIQSTFSGLIVPAYQDGCLAKYNAAGIVQWVHTFGGSGFSDIQEAAVKVSVAGNAVYVCGSFITQIANSTITFDTISYTYAGNSRHGFLAKYDLSGNIQWMKHGGGAGLGAGFNDMDIDDQGRIVVVGTVDGTNVFETQTLTYNGGILLRYLPDGTLTDLIQLNTNSAEHQEAREVEVASGSGNIYVGGAFFGTIALNGFTATSSSFRVFELKLNAALNCQWLSYGGGTNGTFINGLAIDGNENSYLCGQASGTTINFGLQSFNGYTPTDHEVITVKFNAAGTSQWLRHGGSSKNDEAWDIIADKSGNTVITGFLGGNALFADFDGIQVQLFTQSKHCFLARYDANGLVKYARVMGGGSDDVGLGLALANDSTFLLTGAAQSSSLWDTWQYMPCCLDPNLFVARYHDVFNNKGSNIHSGGTLEYTVVPNLLNFIPGISHYGLRHPGTFSTDGPTISKIDNTIDNAVVAIYPNPFSNQVNIQLKNQEMPVTVIVYDVVGKLLFDAQSEDLETTLDLSWLKNGIYFVKVMKEGRFIGSGKIVKQ
ncbi:MAG: T9SS type A sorting domain-containing protein [Chitinophagaceae bacterium]|nr:T9SS type A sorting domain-containing protein [Chitinophagaceae bacterium]